MVTNFLIRPLEALGGIIRPFEALGGIPFSETLSKGRCLDAHNYWKVHPSRILQILILEKEKLSRVSDILEDLL